MQRFLKLLELLNGLDSDENDVKIDVLQSDAIEPTDENDWKNNDVNPFRQHLCYTFVNVNTFCRFFPTLESVVCIFNIQLHNSFSIYVKHLVGHFFLRVLFFYYCADN